jgi:hypothetical protein
MNEMSPPTWASFLSSARTADYVSALIREDDNFDYYRWLQDARAEETQAKQRPADDDLEEDSSCRNRPSNRYT